MTKMTDNAALLDNNKETTKMTDNTALLDKLLQPTGEEEATDYCDEHVYMFDHDPDSDDEYDENDYYEIEIEFKEMMEQIYDWAYDCDIWLRREPHRYSEGDVSSIERQIEDMYNAMSRLHTYASDYVE